MTVITRFAPSPTGALHTGSARTALFNWLFSKHCGGKFLLRIEDTDKERSKAEHTETILRDLKWLGVEWDGEPMMQSSMEARHAEIAHQLLARGKAYKCYSTVAEIEAFRQKNPHAKFHSIWRDKSESEAPAGAPYAIRLKVDHEGSTLINDLIQGEIRVSNSELDDMIMLRSDGTPTYMLAVVVDDHDMKITHVIRGDDHLTNAFRQKQIYDAMDWVVPEFAHIPLIHDKEGSKLSKRKGALGIDAYDALGYLPDAVINHLMRLGWSHGDDEIIAREDAIKWFELSGIGKSPARFDIDKLNFINAHYMRALDAQSLFALIEKRLPSEYRLQHKDWIIAGLDGLKNRAQTLKELADSTMLYIKKMDVLDEKSAQILASGGREILQGMTQAFEELSDWSHDSVLECCNKYAASQAMKPGQVMQALRAGVVGTFSAPGIIDMITIFGKEETLARIRAN